MQVDTPGDRRTPVTGMLEALVLSRRGLAADVAAEIGLAPGTMLGHAAAELLLAVTDPAGPQCRSYRSAWYGLREREGALALR